MNKLTSENTFESSIVESLVNQGGYLLGIAKDYDVHLGLFPPDVIAFIKTTQPEKWEKIKSIHGTNNVEKKLLERLYKELDLRGSLDVLRKGFTDYGVTFDMAYFQPVSSLNETAKRLYEQNLLKVYRQVYYSSKNNNSVDLVISLNGIPVTTLELKNRFTGQNVQNAVKQYNNTRDNKELLFAFKKRALVHFAVDQDEVYMTTKPDGKKTFWLPFNKGYNNGKGNPPNPNGYKTAYLWENILAKDSWMEIVQRFIHLQTEEFYVNGKTYKKEKLIFPRYHQLDAVRKIIKDVKNNKAGKNYLIQHSAGSGKSNTIAWLAYRLAGLHNEQNERIFDTVIVVTDRRVLDQQLQNTIYQFDHKTGVVERIDKNSRQLAEALQSGKNIIITTLQKFPFILEKAGSLPGKKYAVIIDEAHSSQGGESSKKMKEVLGYYSKNNDAKEEDFTGEDYIREQIERSAKARGKQENISFFAFTATPKFKTLQVFGTKDEEGKPKPFHLYSMRQAIEEGFILDVLQNYTTYELFFKLTKAIEEDPKLNKKKAAKAIGRFVSLHPHNIAQKTEIIIEHFKNITSKKIGGKAKAMLVCGSRLHAKKYFEEFNRYIDEKGYRDIKVLVAFSGKVYDENTPDGVSEPELTGYSEKELPKVFEKDEYKILIVADKYQTGFDQPLLHTMYVDKKLSGVKAVQTLSRLNRIYPGKEDTFILDFVNSRNDIYESFQPYYEVTTVKEETDVNHLYDVKYRLDNYQVYDQSEIDHFAKIFFDPQTKLEETFYQKKLYAILDPAIDRFNHLEEDKQDEFKKALRSWINLYAYLSQIMPFIDTEMEKFYAFAKFLKKRLPKRNISEILNLDDEVALVYYRLQKTGEGIIPLTKNETGEISGTKEAGLKRPKDEEAFLSEIIKILNDKFGTDFTEADKLFFDQLEEELALDEELKLQAQANELENFKFAFEDIFTNTLIDRMEQNKDIFNKIMSDEEFGQLVKNLIMKNVYEKINRRNNPK